MGNRQPPELWHDLAGKKNIFRTVTLYVKLTLLGIRRQRILTTKNCVRGAEFQVKAQNRKRVRYHGKG
jgi:hypothetical protein